MKKFVIFVVVAAFLSIPLFAMAGERGCGYCYKPCYTKCYTKPCCVKCTYKPCYYPKKCYQECLPKKTSCYKSCFPKKTTYKSCFTEKTCYKPCSRPKPCCRPKTCYRRCYEPNPITKLASGVGRVVEGSVDAAFFLIPPYDTSCRPRNGLKETWNTLKSWDEKFQENFW